MFVSQKKSPNFVRTSSELLHIFQSIKVKTQRGWYPTFLGGSSCRWIDSTEQFKAPLAFVKLGDLVSGSYKDHGVGVGVSKNRGGPSKSSISIGFSIINHPFWGTPIWKHPCSFQVLPLWGG